MNRAGALLALLALSPVTFSACRSKSSPSATAGTPSPSPLVAARPFDLDVPAHYDPSRPAPLLLALHGYGSEGHNVSAASAFAASWLASAHGIFIAHPDGTPDHGGSRFWDATDACCGASGAHVDDVAYLSAVVDDVASRYAIDRKRVWVIGLSNGGFMAHRLACDAADKFAAIVSVAGATWSDPARCKPTSHVSVLEIHGASDPLVRYEGGTSIHGGGPYPAVDVTVAESAAKNGCAGALASFGAQLGFDGAHPASETEVAKWSGCPAGVDVERWKMLDGEHIPRFTPAWGEAVVAWLEHHPKT
jgi:polyhydroxybutyrate depolymerase